MELTHEFEVPVGADEAFGVLTDVERIAPCMPGAYLDGVEGDTYRGHVKVKVGPIQLTYRGTAELTEQDPDGRVAVLSASGQETRGSGTARATVRAEMVEKGADATAVTVRTDLQITGRPAQFGRGVMADVGERLLTEFARCLADELGGGVERRDAAPPAAGAATPADSEPAPEEVAAGPGSEAPLPAIVRSRRSDAIDVLDVAGGPVLQRLAPVFAVVGLVILVWWWRRRGAD